MLCCVVWSGGSEKNRLIKQMFKMTTFYLFACTQSYSPLVNGFVDDVLWDACPSVNEALLQVAGVTDWCLVHTLLHQSPDSVVNWIQIRTVWWPHIWRDDFWCFLLQQLDCLASRVCRWISCLHGLLPGPFLLSYSVSVFVFSLIFSFLCRALD